jgi:hypothetical protein
MIILLSTVPAFIKGFWGYISNDGGTNQTANRIASLVERQPLFNGATLICTCDSGKASNLYYVTP